MGEVDLAQPPAACPLAPWDVAGEAAAPHASDAVVGRLYCRRLALGHYENFPVLPATLRPEQRDALAAIYGFARLADDFADEAPFAPVAAELLDGWERQLRAAAAGGAPGHPVFAALAEAMRRFPLPERLFGDLLDAFRQDLRQRRYADFEELLDYCRRSANPVGRLVLAVLGDDREETRVWSDAICTALQLVNLWQDLSRDRRVGRLYLPLADCARCGVEPDRLLAGEAPPGLRELLALEIDRTRDLFARGRPLLARSGLAGATFYAAAWAGGRMTLRLVARTGTALLHRRPVLGWRAIPALLLPTRLGR